MESKADNTYRSKIGSIPEDAFDNDPPYDPEVDRKPGSLYDRISREIDKRRKPPDEKALREWLHGKANDEQPRVPAGSPEGGQWTSGEGGSGSGTATTGSNLVTSPEARQAFSSSLAEKYGMPAHVAELSMDETTIGHALAHASGPGISLNPEYWNNPEKFAEFTAEWKGLSVDPTPEGVLTHEMGHKMLQQIKPPEGMSRKFYREWSDKKQAILEKYYDANSFLAPSAYAQEGWGDYAAEAFVSVHTGKTAWPEWADHLKGAADHSKAFWREMWTHGDRDPETGRLKPGARPRSGG